MICLATTEKLRLPVIALAAEAGKPVYVEKPLATTLEEMREIQRVVHAAAIPFCVGHNRRASPAMIDAQRIFRRAHDAIRNSAPGDGSAKEGLPIAARRWSALRFRANQR